MKEITKLSPLRLPIIQRLLEIAYGAAELPALVWDSKRFHEAPRAADAPGEFVEISGADHFSILEQLRRPDGTLVKLALTLVNILNENTTDGSQPTSRRHHNAGGSVIMTRIGVGLKPLQGLLICGQLEMTKITSMSAVMST
jgi:hypothetical protein